MIKDFKERQRKSAAVARTVYNFSFGIIVLVVGLVMLFLNQINSDTLNEYLVIWIPCFVTCLAECVCYTAASGFTEALKKDF